MTVTIGQDDSKKQKHDPSKCLEWGQFDADCCGQPLDISCADGFKKIESTDVCWRNPNNGPDAIRFTCVPGSNQKGFHHDPSKCLEFGAFDADCCAQPRDSSCADSFTKIESSTVCW